MSDLATLRMGVRVDREGLVRYDYQTASRVLRADARSIQDTVQSRRFYLADAVFLVGLEGADRALLERIHEALAVPRWTLYLGRKSYLPSVPVWLRDGLVPESLNDALRSYPFLVPNPPESIRFVVESEDGELRMDQPLGAMGDRRFGVRYVKTSTLPSSEVGHVPLETRAQPAPGSRPQRSGQPV